MHKNMTSIDRMLRIAAAVAIGILFATSTVTGALVTVSGVAAVLLLVTGTTGFCPAYTLRKAKQTEVRQ